jgi:hypothetical protein
MTNYTTRELLTELISHYSTRIHRIAGLYTCLTGLAQEGRLNTGHPYVFVLTAAWEQPVAPSHGGWHSFAHLDPADAEALAKFADNLKCAASGKQLEFQDRNLVAYFGRDTLTIQTFAPVGVMTDSIGTELASCAIARLGHLFGKQFAEVKALAAVLFPREPNAPLSFVDGAVPEKWHEQISGGTMN